MEAFLILMKMKRATKAQYCLKPLFLDLFLCQLSKASMEEKADNLVISSSFYLKAISHFCLFNHFHETLNLNFKFSSLTFHIVKFKLKKFILNDERRMCERSYANLKK